MKTNYTAWKNDAVKLRFSYALIRTYSHLDVAKTLFMLGRILRTYSPSESHA